MSNRTNVEANGPETAYAHYGCKVSYEIETK